VCSAPARIVPALVTDWSRIGHNRTESWAKNWEPPFSKPSVDLRFPDRPSTGVTVWGELLILRPQVRLLPGAPE
jgi:hypothetical protein